ncbi:MAG TPA: N-acetyltransferase [Candidatus Polarisedimenticolaceae bacterium]|nr:N-acetyltransferase [Candidatus Polarisedimenticolaceae bacterium]
MTTRYTELPGVLIHADALVETDAVGQGTRVWAFAHLAPGSRVGRDCNVCDHTFVESGVVLGDRVTVKCGIYLWTGVTCEDDVFLGPNVVFTNDLFPRSGQHPESYVPTLVRTGASLGANSTILAGNTIGRYAMVGAGSVVTRSVPDHALVVGNPARRRGWVGRHGHKLTVKDGVGVCPHSGSRYLIAGDRCVPLEGDRERGV